MAIWRRDLPPLGKKKKYDKCFTLNLNGRLCFNYRSEKEIVPVKPPNYNKELDVARWEFAYEWDDENVSAFVAAKENKPLIKSILTLFKKDDVIPTSSSGKPSVRVLKCV